MTDSKKPPPIPPRAATNRDVLTRKTPPAGVVAQTATPEVVLEDPTGKYEGEQLAEMRKKRPTDKRVEHLEKKNDEQDKRHAALAEDVVKLRVTMGEVKGQLDGQDKALERIELQLRDKQVEHTTLTMARIDVSKEQAKAEIHDGADEKKIKRLDTLDANKARRKLVLLVAGSVFSAGAVLELAKWLIGKL